MPGVASAARTRGLSTALAAFAAMTVAAPMVCQASDGQSSPKATSASGVYTGYPGEWTTEVIPNRHGDYDRPARDAPHTVVVARPTPADETDAPAKRETWFGAELRGDTWSVYTGTVTALFGGIDDDGLRLKTVSGYGQHSYRRMRTRLEPNTGQYERHRAENLFGDVMLGHQVRIGESIVKLYAGARASVPELAPPPDAEGSRQMEQRLGVIGALETWTNLPAAFALKVDVALVHYVDGPDPGTEWRVDAMVGRHVSWPTGPWQTFFGVEISASEHLGGTDVSLGGLAEIALTRTSAVSLAAGCVIDETCDAYARTQFRFKY